MSQLISMHRVASDALLAKMKSVAPKMTARSVSGLLNSISKQKKPSDSRKVYWVLSTFAPSSAVPLSSHSIQYRKCIQIARYATKPSNNKRRNQKLSTVKGYLFKQIGECSNAFELSTIIRNSNNI